MAAPVETEIKLRMDGPDAARRAVTALGASLQKPRHLEDNVLYDDAKSSLYGSGQALRLRREGGRAIVTHKGPRSRHGTGGPGYTIKAEFNDTPHKRGVVSMARAQDPNSAGSQFFIVVKDSGFLDREYTAFGRVVRGMEIADKIVNSPRDARDNPNDRVDMKVRVVEGA